jgi:hypothetical protein
MTHARSLPVLGGSDYRVASIERRVEINKLFKIKELWVLSQKEAVDGPN